ncbi:MAG: hypothetical protein J5497_06210, partial [Selenomonadaceae bacterium]|nr:hypothetical protein [Selenomonadaceae bacterium]
FLKRYPKVKLFLTNFPSKLKGYEGGREFDSQLYGFGRLKNIVRRGKYAGMETPLDKFGYSHEQINEIVEAPDVKRNPDGSTEMLGDDSKLLQKIEHGKRATAYQPETYTNKIYFFGSCHHYGVNAPFDKTLESYLQKMLNESNLPYRVENESQRYLTRYQDIFYNLNKLTPAPGDIIFVWLSSLRSNNDTVPFCDVSDAFDPPHDYREFFCVKGHVNELGYKLVAEKYFKFLTENNFFRDVEFKSPPSYYYSSLRYTAAIRGGQFGIFRQRRAGGLQDKTSCKETPNWLARHELQSFHSRSSIPCRICGIKSH